jgi:hypothetical protein
MDTVRLKRLSTISVWPAILVLACTTAEAPRTSRGAAATTVVADASEGREVLAVIKAFEPKSYTDDLPDGEVLVSNVLKFSVVQPAELAGVTVAAYYQGIPEIDGRRLELGDLLYFRLPSVPRRDGILLWDLKDLRFRN